MTQFPDGNYVLLVEVCDQSGFTSTATFSFMISNWVVLELLPSTAQNKAGRTMPVKFSLKIKEEINPDMPFVINQEVR